MSDAVLNTRSVIAEDPQRDLAHFVRLAILQTEAKMRNADAHQQGHLQILLELLKEQITDENSRRSAGSSR